MENSSGRGECQRDSLSRFYIIAPWCNLLSENFWLPEKFFFIFSRRQRSVDPWADMKRKLNLLLRRPWNPVRSFKGHIGLRLCFRQKKAGQLEIKQFKRKKKREKNEISKLKVFFSRTNPAWDSAVIHLASREQNVECVTSVPIDLRKS